MSAIIQLLRPLPQRLRLWLADDVQRYRDRVAWAYSKICEGRQQELVRGISRASSDELEERQEWDEWFVSDDWVPSWEEHTREEETMVEDEERVEYVFASLVRVSGVVDMVTVRVALF